MEFFFMTTIILFIIYKKNIVSCFAMSDWSAGFWARSGVCFFTILPKVLLILQLLIPYNSASNIRGRNNYRIAAYVIFALNRHFKTATKWYASLAHIATHRRPPPRVGGRCH